jgi:hypothetical protein
LELSRGFADTFALCINNQITYHDAILFAIIEGLLPEGDATRWEDVRVSKYGTRLIAELTKSKNAKKQDEKTAAEPLEFCAFVLEEHAVKDIARAIRLNKNHFVIPITEAEAHATLALVKNLQRPLSKADKRKALVRMHNALDDAHASGFRDLESLLGDDMYKKADELLRVDGQKTIMAHIQEFVPSGKPNALK